MTNEFLAMVKKRRSVREISKQSSISDERIKEIIYESVQHTPSAFNSQSSRAVVLLGEHHHILWDITTEVLKAIVPENIHCSIITL